MKFSIGSFNTRNLALPNIAYYPGEQYTQAQYDKKITWIGKQIDAMKADIIGFQEIFHRDALKKALQDTFLHEATVTLSGEEGNGPLVAIASKYNIVKTENIENIPAEVVNSLTGISGLTKFSRPVLKAVIEVEAGKTVTFLVAHLKSKNPEFVSDEERSDLLKYHVGECRSLIKRSVEAAGLRQIIVDLIASNNNPLVVIGDLNDSQRAVTSEMIAGPNSYKGQSLDDKSKRWDIKLYDAFDILTQKTLVNAWYTHIFNGYYDVLDHIYLSQEFYFRNDNRIWDFDYLKLLNDHLIDSTNLNAYLSGEISDHGQITVGISSK